MLKEKSGIFSYSCSAFSTTEAQPERQITKEHHIVEIRCSTNKLNLDWEHRYGISFCMSYTYYIHKSKKIQVLLAWVLGFISDIMLLDKIKWGGYFWKKMN